ncbi:GNAT family N-acetyltransferase [Pseudotenacibaculum haliotis]|uniref:GNAT family N-acetyltransferase n=1 Tax=Pseudotenacibaculum haliotis TaxID=1862138 RepID=A0ABW5LP56_9FLAO
MISFFHRNEIDESKYNDCISKSGQDMLYAYSWYLDTVVEQWGALVLDDYQAVMPIPYQKKYTIQYVHPPLWILQLGVFSQTEKYSIEDFINTLQEKFRFIELRLNAKNSLGFENYPLSKKNMYQELDLRKGYDTVKQLYKSDRKKDLRRAEKHQLIEKWADNPDRFIDLFKNNVGLRTPEVQEKDYNNLKALMSVCVQKQAGEILSVYEGEQLVASAFFIKEGKTVTILCSSTDFSNRKNGANTFLIDRAISKYSNDFNTFNFGGSSMPSIAKYFLSFGATQVEYPFLKINKLPSLLRLFKS